MKAAYGRTESAGTATRAAPSRRRLLTGAGLAGAGLVAGGAGGYFGRQPTRPASRPPPRTGSRSAR